MIHFECEYCGRKLRVPETHAGRQGRCPTCKRAVVVPRDALPELTLVRDEAPSETGSARPSDDIPSYRPPARHTRQALSEAANWGETDSAASLGFMDAPEHTGERKLPWPLDILLYPASPSGLIILAIVIGGLFLTTITRFYFHLPGLGIVTVLIIPAVLGLYQWWYFAECMYDSAQGGTRAPDLLVPGLGDMWSRVSYMLAVPVIYLLPATLYFTILRQYDAILLGLLAWAILFFPMGLLAMVVNDSVSALNPLFLLVSIARVFLPYLGLLLVLALPIPLLQLVPRLFAGQPFSLVFIFTIMFVLAYVSLIYAHILGRFYWRYRDRLGWGV